MFERFKKASSAETTPSSPELPDFEAQSLRSEADTEQLRRRQAMRLAALCTDFDGTVREWFGDEYADRCAAKQREVASKAHRGYVPPHLNRMLD